MSERKPNMMECNQCHVVEDFKDKYKPDTLFHKCNGVGSEQMGTWRKYGKRDHG